MQRDSQHTLLVVDDEAIILLALKESIASEGYRVVTSSDPREALELLQKQTFAAIISDQRMPSMTGLEFFAEAKTIQPNASRILITGVLSLKTIVDAVNRGEIFRFLAKPWIREELLVTIQNAVQHYELLETQQKLQDNLLQLNESVSNANLELQQKIQELKVKDEQLTQSQAAMYHNFQRSLQLCFYAMKTFHPSLVQQTLMTVEVCKLMGESGSLEGADAYILSVCAWIYNIGLLGTPENIVHKYTTQEKLTQEELNVVREHPKRGQALTTFINDLEEVGQTIRSHCEHWDGSGFPDGLIGESIPRAARYLAVACAYAIGYERPDILKEILALSGKHFAPEAVRLLLQIVRDKVPVRNEAAPEDIVPMLYKWESAPTAVAESDSIDARAAYLENHEPETEVGQHLSLGES